MKVRGNCELSESERLCGVFFGFREGGHYCWPLFAGEFRSSVAVGAIEVKHVRHGRHRSFADRAEYGLEISAFGVSLEQYAFVSDVLPVHD
jgi:hypothetical protein